ncbi:MAG: hypothetical protein JXB14_00820 [Candidatus Altiarchaeota archaeon]|nr:hypothetical protein [Candidatus Altiarchaeota archaeon]
MDRNDSRIRFLKGISDYLWDRTDSQGMLKCYKHHVEHTGKNVYSVIIDSKLYELTKDEAYFEKAKKRVERTLGNLRKREDGVWVFYPGNFDARNASNNLIDAGACIDSLCFFLDRFSDKLSADEVERIKDCIFKVSDTYLIRKCPEENFINQRLWGCTGLAAAYRIFNEKSWKSAVLETLERSFKEQNSDGSFPYLPYPFNKEENTHIGDSDITSYYHSRHVAFAIDAMEKMGVKWWTDKIKKGVDFQIGITHPDGIREMNFEAKRWYWESKYEVGSNPFDIYNLVRGYEREGDPLYRRYAALSFNQLLRHQLKDGGITSHLGKQQNYKCRIFWNAHAAWAAKVIEDVPLEPVPLPGKQLSYFKESGVVKFENEDYCVILRGRKKPMNISFGGSIGGGSMVYLGTREGGWRNLLDMDEWKDQIDNNFVLHLPSRGVVKETREFMEENGRDCSRRLYKAWAELRAGNILFSLNYPIRHILGRYLDELGNVYTSQWSTDSKTTLGKDSVRFVLRPAKRDGKELEKTEITRAYEFDGGGIRIGEKLKSEDRIKKVDYRNNRCLAIIKEGGKTEDGKLVIEKDLKFSLTTP